MEISGGAFPSLKSRLNRDIPPHCQQRLEYLWRAMHRMSTVSIGLSHSLCNQFSRLVHEYAVDLPHEMRQKICPKCSAFLHNPLSCSVKLRLLKGNKKYKNEFVITCTQCKEISQKLKNPRIRKRRRKTRSKPDQLSTAVVENERKLSAGFSFLHNMVSPSSTNSGRVVQSRGTLVGEFIPLSRTVSPAKKKINMNNDRAHDCNITDVSSAKTLNLLDLEREKKRKRKERKKAEATKATSTTSASLQMLKSVFSIQPGARKV